MPISQINTNSIATGAVSASDLADASVTTAKISATGTPSSSTFLRGDGSWQAVTIPANSVSSSSLTSTGRFTSNVVYQNSAQSYVNDSGWVDHVSMTFTTGVACRIMVWGMVSSGYESGAVQGFMKFVLDGSQIGYIWCAGKQSTANSAGSGSSCAYADVSAGSHTIKIQARNTQGSSTWITPYFSADGQGANSLGVMFYG